jgi:Mn-dependent DtxR family transcriptional regulator
MWNEAFFWSLSGNLPQDDETLMAVLLYLREHEGKINVAAMARELGIQRPRCYGIFDRAAFHGLLDKGEKRLTPKGIKLVEGWLEDDNE